MKGQLLNFFIFVFVVTIIFIFSTYIFFFYCFIITPFPVVRPLPVECRPNWRRRSAARTPQEWTGREVRQRTRRTVGSNTDQRRSHRRAAGSAQRKRNADIGTRGRPVPRADQTQRYSGSGTYAITLSIIKRTVVDIINNKTTKCVKKKKK